MKVKYRNKTIDIPNQSKDTKDIAFASNWKYYIIEIIKEEKFNNMDKDYYDKNKYYVMVWNPLGSCIVDGHSESTINKCLQVAVNNITIDINDLINIIQDDDNNQEDKDEIREWLEMMGEL